MYVSLSDSSFLLICHFIHRSFSLIVYIRNRDVQNGILNRASFQRDQVARNVPQYLQILNQLSEGEDYTLLQYYW